MMLLWSLTQAHASCLVVAGATVHTPEGPEKGLTVVIHDDRIAATGRGVPGLELKIGATTQISGATWRGEVCTFVQGADRHLTPGLVAATTNLGLVEVGLERGSRDNDPETDDPIRAALYASDAYDPLSTVLGVARLEGITSAVIAPSGGFIAGHAAFVQLTGRTQAQAVLQPDAAMIGAVPTASWAGGLLQIRELAHDVDAWRRDRAAFHRGRPAFEGASDLDLAALVPVFAGDLPLVVGANDAADLEALIRLQQELGIKLVVSGAAEGWLVADALADAKISVMIDPLVASPRGFDQLQSRSDNAVRLHEAGVDVMVHAVGGHHARGLRQAAGNAVRAGLPSHVALNAITEVPSRVFGRPSGGRIAVGAPADLVLWTGDPLEVTTWSVMVWIDGRPMPTISRQSALTGKYRTLTGNNPAAPLPSLEAAAR